jgi:hypothetical protein
MPTYAQLWKKYSRLAASVAATLTAIGSIYLFVENVASVSARVGSNTEKLLLHTGSISNLHDRVDALHEEVKLDADQDKHVKMLIDQLVVIAKDNKQRIDELDKRAAVNSSVTEQLVTIAKENRERINSLDRTTTMSQATLNYIKDEVCEIKADVKEHLLENKLTKKQ